MPTNIIPLRLSATPDGDRVLDDDEYPDVEEDHPRDFALLEEEHPEDVLTPEDFRSRRYTSHDEWIDQDECDCLAPTGYCLNGCGQPMDAAGLLEYGLADADLWDAAGTMEDRLYFAELREDPEIRAILDAADAYAEYGAAEYGAYEEYEEWVAA